MRINFLLIFVGLFTIAISNAMELPQQAQPSPFALLPDEVIVEHFMQLTDAPNVEQAINNIKAFAATARRFRRILNDAHVTRNLIQRLSNRFNINPITVAGRLGTEKAKAWLRPYIVTLQDVFFTSRIETETLLGEYIQKGPKRLFELLLAYGLSDLNGALVKAAIAGNRDIVELLLARGATNLNEALLGAALGGNRDIVELLLARGATDLDRVLAVVIDRDIVKILEEAKRKRNR